MTDSLRGVAPIEDVLGSCRERRAVGEEEGDGDDLAGAPLLEAFPLLAIAGNMALRRGHVLRGQLNLTAVEGIWSLLERSMANFAVTGLTIEPW